MVGMSAVRFHLLNSNSTTATTKGLRMEEQQRIMRGRKSRIESFDVTDLLADMDRHDLVKSLNDDDEALQSTYSNTSNFPFSNRVHTRGVSASLAANTNRVTSRSIPVPQPTASQQQQQQDASVASSQGSSGSAFMSSVMSPSFGLSHTPPFTRGASSYEQKHFGKRTRSGSVSGRLRSASEYLEEKGLLDGQTKGILKDLVIIGDEELHQALDQYEMGDPGSLEDMIRSGALQNRLPQDLDILGDLDLDFLTMDENVGLRVHEVPSGHGDEIDDDDIDDEEEDTNDREVHVSWSKQSTKLPESVLAAQQLRQLHQQPHTNKVSPLYPDDGIGELEFNGEFDHYENGMHDADHQPYGTSKHDAGIASSPVDGKLSDFEQRLRSNSLFSALLNDPKTTSESRSTAVARVDGSNTSRRVTRQSAIIGDADNDSSAQYGQWTGQSPKSAYMGDALFKRGINIRSKDKSALLLAAATCSDGELLSPSSTESGLTASMEAARVKREKDMLKEQKKKERLEKKEKKQQEKKRTNDEEEFEQHVPGSGRPRRLSDPLLQFSIDEFGMQHVDRPEGWIGAYSPDSRRVRIERFIEKRNHRVWTKSVKYDVRKNFADSRLRVKGRFVKKEEESLMRELMSLT
jgi:CCT motif